MTAPLARPVILPMRRADLSAVRRVATAASLVMPGEPALAQELARAHVEGRVLRPAPGEPVAGFVWLWLLADGAEIMHLAVAPGQRRHGFGASLMGAAMEAARRGGAEQMRLEVRVSNAAALALYDKLGFVRVGLRPRYYSDNGEDAVLMCASVG